MLTEQIKKLIFQVLDYLIEQNAGSWLAQQALKLLKSVLEQQLAKFTFHHVAAANPDGTTSDSFGFTVEE